MSDEVKKEETKAANTEEKSELSDEKLEDASGGTYYKYESGYPLYSSWRTGAWQ